MNKEYDREELREICDEFNLVDYVGRDHELYQHGSEYAMHCPMHKDVNPSCYINGNNNRFYCHSCHKSGTILQWLMLVEKLPYKKAVQKIQDLSGRKLLPHFNPSSLLLFKELERLKNNDEKSEEREILPEDYYNRFEVIENQPTEWIDEGIQPDTLRKYDIRIDTKANRIVYPVRDNNGHLIGVKGRTRFKEWKLLGLKKYMNYTKIGSTDFLQGMYENKQNILNKDEIIIFEGLKSVMLASQWGFNNSVSAETSRINDEQAKIIMQLGISNAVFAFDNDVEYTTCLESARKISRWMNVYIIYDRLGILGDKSEKLSPCDKGEEIFRTLYKERIRVH